MIAFAPAGYGANDSCVCLAAILSEGESVIAYRKIFLVISTLILTVCLCACSKMADSLPNYISFDQLAERYGVEDAVADDCVVFIDSKLISGEDIWKTFVTKAEKKQSCSVRIANYISTDSYFSLTDLSYEGSCFRVNTSEGTYGEYKYLNHYEIHIKDSDSDDSVRDLYILVDKEDATYDAIQKSWASSVPNGGIASYIVYSNIY